jgi:hypothetical protein
MAFVFAKKIEIIVWKVRIPQCQWDRGIRLGCFCKRFRISMRQRKRTQRRHWNRGIRTCGINEAPGLDPAVSMRARDPFWHCGIIYKIWSRNHRDRGIQSFDLIENGESNLCKCLSRFSRRIRSHIQNGFSPWIRALGGVFDEKKPMVENLVTLSL